jgi:hypothetical protein
MAEEKDFIIVLFKTLKEAIYDMNSTLKDMLNNQKTIGTYVENLPIKELKDTLKEHNKESNENIDECTEAVNLQTKDIIEGISNIKDILIRTIITISVFFGIVTSGWFYKAFVSPSINPTVKLEKTITELQDSIETDRKIIEELRETIKGLHDPN